MHIKFFEEFLRVCIIRLFGIVYGQNGFSILHLLRLDTYLPMLGEAVDPFAIWHSQAQLSSEIQVCKAINSWLIRRGAFEYL